MKLKLLIKKFISCKRFQRIWNFLFKLSLKGLNIGNGSEPETSGEKAALIELINNNVISNNPIIFDVGANIGAYASEILDIVSNAKVFCFEPSKDTFFMLKNNIINNNVILNNIGLSNIKGQATLYSDKKGSGLASLYKRQLDYLNIKLSNSETIILDTLDNYCKENNINEIDLLKIDVEGNELNVINGGKNLLSNCKIKAIQIEFGGCNVDARTYFKDFWTLLSNDFNVYRIVSDGLYKIDYYNFNLEIFTTTNYMFIRK